jgi:hypothetical protein
MKGIKLTIYSLGFVLCFTFSYEADCQKRIIRGIVKDRDSQETLPGATIMVLNTNPVLGTTTDANGAFRIENVPVGRYSIQVSYIGYESVVVAEVLVQTGKETYLEIQMKQSATTLEGVSIRAFANKEQAVNPMAMISSRQLTMEEASRYAGGIDDPARLATAFAGVAGSLSSNAIVIRGNAPKGLLWRMEGIEIPNPSHFANVSTFGGGGITALSSQMLSNSDFFTGAFPAEFGNALSGVFDMRIRNGNNEKREHTIKAGIIGVDFATEGPFVKGRKSSYLMNYRYSTLALISPLLPQNAQGIKYQDLSFKLNFPMGKKGTLSAWGLFSTDRTGSKVKEDSTQWAYYQDIEEDVNKNRMGAAGINYKTILSESTYLNTALAATGNLIYWHRERLDSTLHLYPKDEISQNDRKYTISFLINHKFGSRHTNRTGININYLAYRVNLKQNEGINHFKTFADKTGNSTLVQVYSQSRIDLAHHFTLNAGIHSQWFTLNRDLTFEPRISLKWNATDRSSFSVAYGLHSRMEPMGFYFAMQQQNGRTIEPNLRLKFTRSEHYILSWEIKTGEYSRFRLEPYCQKMSKVPVIPNSSFSMQNLEMDWFFNDSLVNRGTGYNVGTDITLERFLHDGFYYLFTASLFDSRYKGDDGVERNSRFNKNYVVNFLFGKEWLLGKEKNNMLSLNWKFSVLGGDRISPVNYAASYLNNDVIYDEQHAFEERKPDVWYLDFTASWHKNHPRYSGTWSVQFVNLLFQKEFYGYRYNFRTDRVEPLREVVVIPNLSYRIDF